MRRLLHPLTICRRGEGDPLSLLFKKRSKRGLTGRLLFLIRLNRMRFLGVPAQRRR